jgi:hypothetical protein
VIIRENDGTYEATLQGGSMVARSDHREVLIKYVRSEWPGVRILVTNPKGGYTEVKDADSG